MLLISDSFLLNNYDITYVEIAEAWGKIIHDSKIEIAQDYVDENSKDFKPVKVKNNPKKIVDSFHNRLQQFKKIAEGNGSIFINSLEPFLLASFARILPGQEILDIGTGCGIIPLIMAHREPEIKVTGIEIQNSSANRAE